MPFLITSKPVCQRCRIGQFVVFADKLRRLSCIHEAVRFGDVTELQAMVQSGAGINDLDPKFKFTPLHWACNYGSLEVLAIILFIVFQKLVKQ